MKYGDFIDYMHDCSLHKTDSALLILCFLTLFPVSLSFLFYFSTFTSPRDTGNDLNEENIMEFYFHKTKQGLSISVAVYTFIMSNMPFVHMFEEIYINLRHTDQQSALYCSRHLILDCDVEHCYLFRSRMGSSSGNQITATPHTNKLAIFAYSRKVQRVKQLKWRYL
jgi:hypothetical protein